MLGAIIGGAFSLLGASKAAKAQERAGREQIAFAKETRDLTRSDLAPYVGMGVPAVNALMFEMGLGPRPTVGGAAPAVRETQVAKPMAPGLEAVGSAIGADRGAGYWNPPRQYDTKYSVGGQTFDTREAAEAWARDNAQGGSPYEGISMSPASRFLLEQGRDSIEAGAASRGGLYSGASLQGLEDYRQNVALGDRENQLNRLMQFVGVGQNAAAGQGVANATAANQTMNALANIGNAQAAGYIGGANAINNTIGNIYGYQQFNRLFPGGNSGGGGGGNFLSGLFGG